MLLWIDHSDSDKQGLLAVRHLDRSSMPLKQQSLNFDDPPKEQPKKDSPLPQLLFPDDIYRRAEELVPLLCEDRRIERKSAGASVALIAEYLSCWANTSPYGGIIVVGIEDKTGKILGCRSIDENKLNNLEKAGMDHCPDAVYETKRIPVTCHDGQPDFLLVYRVKYHPTRVVETSNRKVYVRLGDSCREVKTDAERHQLRIDKGEVQFEQEPAPLAYPDEFDIPAIHAFAGIVRENRGLASNPPDTKVLELMHLGKRRGNDFLPNIACALAFAKDPLPLFPGCKVRILRFEGEKQHTGDEWNAVLDEVVEGSIPEQLTGAAAIIESQIRKISVFDKKSKFQTQPEYPRDAWFEALVNACVHRSYNYRNANIFVWMYEDRMIIESPGPFPPGITTETIYDYQHSRNPFLMEVMKHLGFVKAANEGVKRIRETMLKLKLPEPEFKQIDSGSAKITVVLQNDIKNRRPWVDADVVAKLGAALTKQLTENERIVMNYVVIHGRINVSEAVRLTAHNWPTAKKLLTGLQERGILRYVRRSTAEQADRKAHWVLNIKPSP